MQVPSNQEQPIPNPSHLVLETLQAGGITFILVILSTYGFLWMGIEQLFKAASPSIDALLTSLPTPAAFDSSILYLLKIIVWLAVSPLLLLSTVFCCRIIFIHKKLSLIASIKEMQAALKCATQGIWWMLRLLPYYLAALGGILIMYPLLKPYMIDARILYSFYAVVGLITLLSSTKLIPSFLIPIVATAGLYLPHYADQVARALYTKNVKRMTIFFFAFTIIMTLLVRLSLVAQMGLIVTFLSLTVLASSLVIAGSFIVYELATFERRQNP